MKKYINPMISNENTRMENHQSVIELQDMGSFYIGGSRMKITGKEVKEVTLTPGGEPVKFDLNETFHSGDMYVQFFIPGKVQGKYPLLFWHGGGLTGATYETTPDGRSGWLNYFIQKGWVVYNSDAVERGRAGWLPYHPTYSEEPLLFPEYYPYEVWRIGEGAYNNGDCKPYENSQFPIGSYKNLVKQLVPSWSNSHHDAMNAYMDLVKKNDLSIILAHSQGATYAFKVAEACPENVKAIIAVEPGGGGDIQNAWKLKGIPILSLYGDNIDKSERWTKIFNRTQDYYDAIKDAGGKVDVVMLPEKGFTGNSHMMMMEKNNIDIADFIQEWLQENGLYED